MITAKNLVEIEELIGRWERGETVWSDPPLCSLLVTEVARLRRLLRDLYPFVVGTPMQEEIRAEMLDDTRVGVAALCTRRRGLLAAAPGRGTKARGAASRRVHA